MDRPATVRLRMANVSKIVFIKARLPWLCFGYSDSAKRKRRQTERKNIMNWYKKAWQNYAQFSGRAQRAEYWWFTGINIIVIIVLRLIATSLVMASGQSVPETVTISMMLVLLISFILLVFALAIIMPSIAVTVRRLHDIGKSGWWYLLILIPFAGALIIFIMTLLDSEPSTNKYGANPKEESHVQLA